MFYKRIVFLFMLFLLLTSACSTTVNQSEVVEIRVSDFEQFGNVNEDFHTVFQGREEIKIIINAINSAKKQDGVVDMSEGDYDLEIVFEEEVAKGYHLWINGDWPNGTIMNVEDTHIIYKLTEKATEELRSLIK